VPVKVNRLLCARPTSVVATLALVVLFGVSCAGKKAETDPQPPPDVAAAQEVIRAARAELEKGDELALEGQWSDARLAFDRAVDLLLDVPGGVASLPEAQSLYDDVLATIHDTERAALNALSDDAAALEQAEGAAVDELTNEVLIDEFSEEADSEIAATDLPEVTYDIPIVLNARVKSIIEMFQLRRRDWFQEALDRGGYYAPMIRQIFTEEGIPQDLIYLAMVESAYKSRAVSKAGARGIWQFIQGTGRAYGLRQDFWVDDRFNPEKATRAAARHLKDLYEDLGDWYLVMAAYNSGQRRVERAIRRTGSRDFWVHAQKRVLPRETRSYVPLIIAATVIGKNPEAYGFVASTNEPIDYDVVRLEFPVDLSTASKSAGVSLDDMKFLNPELRRWVTPLDNDSYPLRIPKGNAETFKLALAEIPEDERVRFGTHVVRRGDTLSRIASRYGTTIDALTSANNITRRSLIHPGQVLTVPVPPGSGGERIRSVQRREAIAENGESVYVIQRGDTLGAISSSFRMSLKELRALNGIGARATRIYPGQRIIVTERAAKALAASNRVAPAAPRSSGPSGNATYTVRPGDTLGHIAEEQGVKIATLRQLNGLSSRQTRIHPGQELYLREASASTQAAAGPTSYRIRSGDTLSKIARRFGVTIEQIRQWNNMSSDHIVAGDRLSLHVNAGTN
jgi:membrane-bound lytic murein transglycosylase D